MVTYVQNGSPCYFIAVDFIAHHVAILAKRPDMACPELEQISVLGSGPKCSGVERVHLD